MNEIDFGMDGLDGLDMELDAAGLDRHWETPAQKAARCPNSLRLAVNAMCASCVGSPDRGWRVEIRNCTARNCALHPHRPFRNSRARALKAL